jgi:hypothetical protein
MSAATILAILLAVSVGGGVTVGSIQQHRLNQEREARAADVAALEADKQELAADLATCQAMVTPESITATGKVLEAAQASDIADVQLRAAVVAAIPSAMLAQAVVDSGSPQSIAAYAALAGCWSQNTTGDSSRSGCGPQGAIVTAWASAVAALPACSESPQVSGGEAGGSAP